MNDAEKRRPSFNIIEPNPLMGNKTLVIFNPEMTRSLCELVENLADDQQLSDEQKHLYAFAKRLRAHYFDMSKMYEEKGTGEPFSKRADVAHA